MCMPILQSTAFYVLQVRPETIIEHKGEARIRMYSADKQKKDWKQRPQNIVQKNAQLLSNNPLLKSFNSAKAWFVSAL